MSTAVVNSTECPFRQAAWPRAIDKCVLPRPTLPIRTMLVWVEMKARRNRFWICGRLIFLGQFHWKSVEGFEHGEARVLDASFDAAVLAHRGFALNQLLQIIQVRALLLGSFGGQGLVVALDVVQVQTVAGVRVGILGNLRNPEWPTIL